MLSAEMQLWLMEHVREASERARGRVTYGNPSTTVYRLTEELERMKLKQMVLDVVRSAGLDGAMCDAIYEGVKTVMPGGWSKEMGMKEVELMLEELKSEGEARLTDERWFASE